MTKTPGPTLLVLTLAMLAPFPARAVLLPEVAAKVDQNPEFKGCSPSIGFGASRPQPAFCRDLHTPEEYCGYYGHATANVREISSLENDTKVQKAYRACLDFYRAAVDSQQLVCDYQRDAAALQEKMTENAAQVDSASSAQQGLTSNIQCVRKFAFYYQLAAVHQKDVIAQKLEPSATLLLDLADVGAANLKAEVHCQKDGVPNAPPGALLIGLSNVAVADQKKTHENLSRTLLLFQDEMRSQGMRALAYGSKTALLKTDLNSVGGRAIPGRAGESDITGAGDDKNSGSPTKTAATDGGQQLGTDVAKSAVKAEGKLGRSIFVRALDGAESIGKAASGEVGGIVLSLATAYATGGIDRFDVANALGTAGVALVGGVTGAPFIATAGGVGVTSLVVERLRRDWNEYDKKVIHAYVSDMRADVVSYTSQQLAERYKPTKLSLAYCSKCSAYETLHASCPGKEGHAHGFQDTSFLLDSGTNPIQNPWVVEARAHCRQLASPSAASSCTTSGSRAVSPVEKAP